MIPLVPIIIVALWLFSMPHRLDACPAYYPGTHSVPHGPREYPKCVADVPKEVRS